MKLRSFLIILIVGLSLLPFFAYFFHSNDQNSYRQSLMAEEIPKKNTRPENARNTIEISYPKTNNHQSPLGINANEIYEQDSSIPFIDLFHVATPFHENIRCRKQDQPCLTSASVTYDKQGWPKNLNGGKAGVFFLRNISLDALPLGDFSVIYDGVGKISYLHNVELITSKPGEDVIRFNAREDGFMTAALQIIESDENNPLRNIRILMPGGICNDDPFHHAKNTASCTDSKFLSFKEHYKDIIFNPDYLNFMKDFSVIRFMPMSGITRNPAQHWDQRPTMDKATWGGIYGSRGAPLEIQIALANKLRADPWLNVPHAADDNYMTRFAIYVNENLSPELTPHIEYTNEAWNANFIHNEYMQKMGVAQKLDKDALMAGYKYYAKRSVEFFDLWELVYGGNDKFVRIIGGWDTRPDISGVILAYNDTYKSVDALAIAPYIGGNLRGFRESKTVDDIFKLLNDKQSYRSLPKIMHELEKHAALAKEFGVSLIAYEGGQGLVDWAAKDYLQHPNPLFFAANRDSRMADLYQTLFSEWKKLGADLFVAFRAPSSCNASGCWGLKEHIRKTVKESPKLAASLAFMSKNKKWWDWDKTKQINKPTSSQVSHYIPKRDPNKPRIVMRPAKGNPDHFFRLENPQALNILLEGETWDKRDISGKWQAKWSKKYLYFTAKVYDKEKSSDSDDPTQDDSIELFIDSDNNRGKNFNKNKDYHFVFTRNGNEATMGKQNPSSKNLTIPYTVIDKYDGYEIHAKIKWSLLGYKPRVKNKLGFDVIINDDDDGGERDARIGWNTHQSQPKPEDFGMVLISGR